jgi:predicted site-specific integrase-resolvase
LTKLILLIISQQVTDIVITHKDRLLRFGFELIEKLCHFFGITIHIINKQNDVSFEQELSQDIIMLMTVFSARYYGKRSHKNKIKVSGTA